MSAPRLCDRCGRDVSDDDAFYMTMDYYFGTDGVYTRIYYRCSPKCHS